MENIISKQSCSISLLVRMYVCTYFGKPVVRISAYTQTYVHTYIHGVSVSSFGLATAKCMYVDQILAQYSTENTAQHNTHCTTTV